MRVAVGDDLPALTGRTAVSLACASRRTPTSEGRTIDHTLDLIEALEPRQRGYRDSASRNATWEASIVRVLSEELGRERSRLVVCGDKIPWPTRGPNAGQTIGSTMRSRANRGTKSACK